MIQAGSFELNPVKLYSVRVTLSIDKRIDNKLDLLAKQLNITQKEYLLSVMLKHQSVVPIKDAIGNSDRISKTKVVAMQFLEFIEEKAKQYKMHRDDVFESLLASEIENPTTKHIENAMNIITELQDVIEKKEQLLIKELGFDHPIISRLSTIAIITENLLYSIENNMKYGSPIHPDDFSDQGNKDVFGLNEIEINQSLKKQPTMNTYLKHYKSNVSNAKKTLDKKISKNLIYNLLPEKSKFELEAYNEFYLWDFGKKAFDYLKKSDIVWIETGNKIYKGEIVSLINDEQGEIGEVVGWGKQFKAPWQNPVVLTNVLKYEFVPEELVKLKENSKQLIKDFYMLNS
jgi:hypothetical protein